MSLIHNEKAKLTALWLSTLSGAAITVGVIAPLRFYGVPDAPIGQSLRIAPRVLKRGRAECHQGAPQFSLSMRTELARPAADADMTMHAGRAQERGGYRCARRI